MWDTNSAASRLPRVPGELSVNASSIASVESVVASSSLPAKDSIVAGSSIKMAAATPPVDSDISLVPPVTRVPGLVNSEPMQFTPVEAL